MKKTIFISVATSQGTDIHEFKNNNKGIADSMRFLKKIRKSWMQEAPPQPYYYDKYKPVNDLKISISVK